MDSLLEQFLQEARESLTFIDHNIEDIGSDDPEKLNALFRAAHTLKGGSGIVEFDAISDITHYAEDLLDLLRSKKIEFKESMLEALFNAFDEVMNLVEAAEESGEIVEANKEVVDEIIAALNKEMNKEADITQQWRVPFFILDDPQRVLNYPLRVLRGIDNKKIAFKNDDINEEICEFDNLYAVEFDVDETCMINGFDPTSALSGMNDKVLGVYTCMSDDSAKSILSGIDDENGLLLKSHITAFICAGCDEIKSFLKDFIDDIQVLPLDISTLLSVSAGDSGHKLDSLKELANVTENSTINDLVKEVKKSMELIGKDTLQYSQLQRFLDIAGLIRESDIPKLASFFKNIYKGEVYNFDEFSSTEDTKELTADNSDASATQEIKLDEDVRLTIKNMLHQQYKALDYVENDDDFQRISSMMLSMKKYIPNMPESFSSKNDIAGFLESELDIAPKRKNEQSVKEKTKLPKKPQTEPLEVKQKKKEASVTAKEESRKSVIGKTVNINQESIDSLMNIVGELLVAKNSLPYLADNVMTLSHAAIKREIMEKYTFINRLSEQLQDLIMDMRMLPISYVFDRYPKLVRDIAKKLGKKVHLDMEGGETKLDKNMIEMLADPLIHIMRNSLDHGLESPELREQKGKDSQGNISLKAYTESDRIIIKVEDDGVGINIDRVIDKVLEKGLMSKEQIDGLSQEQKAELILLPGLSTTDEITEFSGRGVGMDVVKKSIESFGGTINIQTKENVGTVITLSIPVSLAVTSLLHIQMNGIHYGIPMDSVSETVKLDKDEIEYLHNEPFVYIRGDVIPLLFIKSMLDEEQIKDKPLSIVVLNIKGNLLAVVVNKFLGQLDVVQKPLVGIMESHPLFSGTALLGNGQIIMAIDPIGLFGISQKLKKSMEVA